MRFINHNTDETAVDDLIFQQRLKTAIGSHELFRVDNDNTVTKWGNILCSVSSYIMNKMQIHTWKLLCVAILADMNMASTFNFAKIAVFCSPRMFKGVTMIWIPWGRKRSGIQKVKVLPMPVPAIEIISRSPCRTSSQTCTCHEQGNFPKDSRVLRRISSKDGICGLAAMVVHCLSEKCAICLKKHVSRLDNVRK